MSTGGPEVQQCVWEWNGEEWVLVSGPNNCTPPLPPRDPPGTKITVDCPAGSSMGGSN